MKTRLPFARQIAEIAGLLLFTLAYYSPFLLDSSALTIDESRVTVLFSSALTIPAVKVELLRNLLGHLLPLALCYFGVVWLAGSVARVSGLRVAVTRLLLLTATWLLLVHANGLIFPLSDYSIVLDTPARPVFLILAGLVLGGAVMLAMLHNLRRRRVALVATLVGVASMSVGAARWEHSTAPVNPPARNIIVIGVDSLSNQMADAILDQLPNLATLLRQAERFERAYTPLGRTFPAWTSLLSGQSPATHGAIFNLRGLDRVHSGSLLTSTLGAAGYHRVFALDERRFSNIDESWGFDRVVGPKAGVLDFVLQGVNDTPLTNLLLQTSASRYLLPFSRLNAASHASYDADGFVDETLAAAVAARPLFLAVHFESAHFPFKSRHQRQSFDGPNHFAARHKGALTGVDVQVGRLMTGLRNGGYLDDALVIVLSDHGESLGEDEALTTRAGQPFTVSGYGHGTNLLSEHQNRIVLGLVRFRNGQAIGPGSVRSDQVSLTDLRAVIERYAESGEVALPAGARCMIVETGIRFLAAADYTEFNAAKLATEAADYYEIDTLGRMRLREDRLAPLVEAKDIGWRCRDRLTWYSAADNRFFAYRILDEGRRLVETRPAASDIARIATYRDTLRDTYRRAPSREP